MLKKFVFSAFIIFTLFSCAKSLIPHIQDNQDSGQGDYQRDIHSDSFIVTAENLSEEELCGIVIMSGIDSDGALTAGEALRISRVKPGAIMLFRKNLKSKDKIKELTKSINSLYIDKPFIAVDHEGGFVHRFGEDIERLPSPFSYWELSAKLGKEAALKRLEVDAERSAKEISALGINMNLAPVVEVLTDENKNFLDDRSYGTDLSFVCDASGIFIRAMSRNNVLCVIKHFPGNTGTDPHKEVPLFLGSAADLEKLSSPFYSVIKSSNPAGIMVSHIIAKAWDSEHNASLSSVVINEKLIVQGGFDGIVLADDFSMGAAGNKSAEENSVSALNAGCDMVMAWPNNVISIHSAILKSLRMGKIKRERLVDAASHIIKHRSRLH